MCGIAGAFGIEDLVLLRKMMEIMRYRGPDDSGTFSDNGVMLGNVRLSIIDIKGGKQPIFNEDKSIVVVYNGEIYNFPELKADLQKKGHKFSTHSDTEVIVHAYEEYGPACASLFNGMFAYAIWDSLQKRLILARDRAGIKPLFYCKLGKNLLFSSDVKSILLHPEVKRTVDLQAMHSFLNLRYVQGEKTMFAGISRLPASHYAVIDKNGMKFTKYWQLSIEKANISEDGAASKLREIFSRAIKRHMISDIPVGVFLSGGFDSSAIVAAASKVTTEPLRTFSMGFGEPDDELKDARVVADHFKTDHHEFIIEKTVLKDFPEVIWYMGTPKRNVYPYYIYKAASKKVKVALGGLGGDELFGGYSFRYDYLIELEKKRKIETAAALKERAKIAKEAIAKQLASAGPEEDYAIEENRKIMHITDDTWSYLTVATADRAYELEYLRNRIYAENLSGGKLLGIDSIFRPYFEEKGDLLERCLKADFEQKMRDDFLVVDDGTSMANSLEIRTPFLDNEMIDFAFSLPHQMKIEQGKGKLILRKAMKGLLPESVFSKKKQGFATNTFSVYTNEMKGMAENYLPNGSIVKNKFVKQEYVARILSAKPDQKMLPQYNMLWNLLALELWHRIFIEGEVPEKPPTAI
jgi:asparagine synthase (glutamine-hydrolysing)